MWRWSKVKCLFQVRWEFLLPLFLQILNSHHWRSSVMYVCMSALFGGHSASITESHRSPHHSPLTDRRAVLTAEPSHCSPLNTRRSPHHSLHTASNKELPPARSCKELPPTRSRPQRAAAGAGRGQGAAAAVDAEVGEQGDVEEEKLLAEERGRVVRRGHGRGLLRPAPARRRPLPRHRGLEAHHHHLATARAPGGGTDNKRSLALYLRTRSSQHTPTR